MLKVFIVEDEQQIADILNDYLQASGYETRLINRGNEVIPSFRKDNPDLILLDIMLPGKDGMTICKEIREFSDIPIIMLTARVEEIDRLLGLEFGADDYICKPFSPREVVARVNAVLRRFNNKMVIDNYQIQLNDNNYKVEVGTNNVELTAVEYKLFKYLYSHPGVIFSRAQLMEQIYDDHRVVSDRTIDSHIKKLRKKINSLISDQEFIHSVYSVGYKYEQIY